MSHFSLHRLTGTLGATVTGIDLSKPLGAEALAALKDALYEHLVLFFPAQHLDDESQRKFACHFGEPYIHPIGRLMGANQARVERIIDSAESHPYQDRWHTDVSFDVSPPTVGTLRAIEIPEYGGDTLWASTRDAYYALPGALQDRIRDLIAVHDSGAGEAFIEKSGREMGRIIVAAERSGLLDGERSATYATN